MEQIKFVISKRMQEVRGGIRKQRDRHPAASWASITRHLQSMGNRLPHRYRIEADV
jgi:hypothetical protein